MNIFYKHYIRHDKNGNVIDFASDGAGRSKLDKSYVFLKNGGYQFTWNGIENPVIRHVDGCPIYKGKMELRTEEENEEWRTKDPLQEIHKELEELDKTIPRWGEDAIEGKPVYGEVAAAIQRKKELRTMLEG